MAKKKMMKMIITMLLLKDLTEIMMSNQWI